MCSKTTANLSFENINEVSKCGSSSNSQPKEILFSCVNSEITNVTKINNHEKYSNKATSARRALSRIIENYVVVWLDSSIDEYDKNYKTSIDHLQRIVNTVRTFTVSDQCITFLNDSKDLKIFLILACGFYNIIVPLIDNLSQIDSVYIFCIDEIKCNAYNTEWKKVKGIYPDISLIADQFKRKTRQLAQDLTTIGIISSSYVTDLNQLDPSFMYSQLLKEILLTIEHEDHVKQEFIEFCRIQYNNNQVQLQVIDQFDQNYHAHSPIWWYTKESFIYSVLNTALRTQDIEIILKMRFFLRDLHQAIKQLHSKTNYHWTLTVYRGQGISNIEFKKIINGEVNLLSFNNFLSTSLNYFISLQFAESSLDDPDLMGILFQMEIDPDVSSAPFVSLHNISQFPDEQEVLFSMHTVFRIDGIEKIRDRLWMINLKLTRDNDEQLACLTEHMRKEIEGQTKWDQLGSLMYKMGKFDKAEEIYTTLLETTLEKDLERLAFLHHEIGRVLFQTGDLQRALSCYEKTIEIQLKLVSSNHLNLGITYRNMGNVHCSMGNYSTARSYHEKALEFQQKLCSSDNLELADTYNNIGWVDYLLGEYSNALIYCEKALEMKQKSVPKNHPQLAYIHDSVGRIHYSMGNNSNALLHYKKTLEIQLKSFPHTHPHISTSYCNIGEVYHSMENWSQALAYYEKTLEIRQKSFPSYSLDLAYIYNKLGEVYYSKENNPIALDYYQRTVAIHKKLVPPNYPDLAITYRNIGLVHQSMRDYSTALSYCQEALEISTKVSSN